MAVRGMDVVVRGMDVVIRGMDVVIRGGVVAVRGLRESSGGSLGGVTTRLEEPQSVESGKLGFNNSIILGEEQYLQVCPSCAIS